MKLISRILLGPAFLLPIALPAHATDPKYIDEMVAKAEKMELWKDPTWRKLLYMRKSLIFRQWKSLFDDPDFFLNERKSKKDKRGEMLASIRALLDANVKIKVKNEFKPAQCIFTARFDYFKEKLGLDMSKVTQADCPDLRDYLKFADYSAVSLVFSNYFPDNPASMFGHTLLRLHRENKGSDVGLLDDAANFAAQIQVMNPLTYPWKGLFGFFKGRFALLPYSEKIQEYNNYESRDLWEYELNYSPEELRRLTLVMWEAGYFWMNYYYLDENCAFMMLAFLEAAKPELELISQFGLYAIPSDTLKAVARNDGLIRKISFKPSASTRYLERARSLNSNEKDLFVKIIRRFENEATRDELDKEFSDGGCNEDCRVRMLDTLIEFIDYQEKKISIRKVTTYEKLRNVVLLSRSKIHQLSKPLTYRPEHSRPDLGARSAALEWRSGWTDKGLNISTFRWRPAFHDLTSSSLGQSDQLEILVLDTVFAWDQELGGGLTLCGGKHRQSNL